MLTIPAVDLKELMKNVPRGAWVAISEDGQRVVAYGSDMREVLDEAKRLGEKDPLIARVPESTAALIL
jgi:hypothetical protein